MTSAVSRRLREQGGAGRVLLFAADASLRRPEEGLAGAEDGVPHGFAALVGVLAFRAVVRGGRGRAGGGADQRDRECDRRDRECDGTGHALSLLSLAGSGSA